MADASEAWRVWINSAYTVIREPDLATLDRLAALIDNPIGEIGEEATQGQDSFLFHSQNMTVAARAIAERKTLGHLS